MMNEKDKFEFKLNELRPIIEDLLSPNMKIFWTYFALASIFTWATFLTLIYMANHNNFSWAFYCIFIFCFLSTYHAVTFTHELSHLDRKKYKVFYWSWNIFIGCAFAIPSFIYGDNHLDHHSKRYGTLADPEYINFKKHPTLGIIEFLGMNFFLPYLGIIRFGFLTPLSHIHKKIRELILKEASFMGMRSRFTRRLSSDQEVLKSWAIQEVITFLFLWTMTLICFTGIIHWSAIIIWASIITCVGIVNGLRALAVTHKYASTGEEPISWHDHIHDCVEIEKTNLSTILFCPVGTQYHLTHHMFQGIPFHNLAQARRRLCSHFSKDSFYYKNVRVGIWDGIVEFLKEIY